MARKTKYRKSHIYKINDTVIFRHPASGGTIEGKVIKLTWYPGNVKRASYTVKANGMIFPLLGIDTESDVGNIYTADTQAGRVLKSERDEEESSVCRVKQSLEGLSLAQLREKAKELNVPWGGKKKGVLLNFLVDVIKLRNGNSC